MLEAFIRGLIKAGLEPDYRDVEDILWLARFLPAVEAKPGGEVEVRQPPEPAKPLESTGRPEDGGGVGVDARRRKVRVSTDAGGGVYVPQQAHGGTGARRARLIRVPAVRALPRAAEIARSLRPLMRRHRSRSRYDLDIEASVEYFAQTGMLAPVLRPAFERWFDVALVVDDTVSMAVWKQATAELHKLFARHGAFRDVRRWTLITKDGRIQLVSESGLVQDWRELIDPTSRRLILVVSDCAGKHWDAAAIWKMLSAWGATSPSAIIQLLPERMWQSTAIGTASIEARSRFPGVPNTALELKAPRWSPLRPKQDVAIPVVAVDPGATGQWARVVMGAGNAVAPAVAAKRPAVLPEPESSGSSAEQLVRRYKIFASVTAYRLAVYLSAVQLTFPVMRLVQETMLPGTDQQYLAEFLLGGLVHRVTEAGANVASDEVEYDFYPGVRETLRGLLLEGEVMKILQAISRFLEENYGSPLDMRALIEDPGGAETLSGTAQPFAVLGASALKRFRGAAPGTAGAQTIEEEEYAPGITIRGTVALGAVQEAAWSPDGSMFALRRDDGVHTYLAGSLQPVDRFSPRGLPATAIAWITNEVLVCASAGDVPELYLLSDSGPTQRRLDWAAGDQILTMRAAPASDLLAIGLRNGQVVYFDTGAEYPRSQGVAPDSSEDVLPDAKVGLDWSPDGRSLAISYPGGKLVVDHSRGEEGELQRLSPVVDRAWQVAGCAWSPDGRLLAAVQSGMTVGVWQGETRIGELEMELPAALSFSHDGAFLAARGSPSLCVWRTDTWEVVAHTDQASRWTNELSFSPARSELIVVDSQVVHILRLDQGVTAIRSTGMKARVFIGSSSEQVDTAYAIQRNLERTCDATVWDQGVFVLTSDVLDDLVAVLDRTDFGIFVFGPDDLTTIRAKEFQSTRDNVVFELGLFIGKLGKARTFFVMPKERSDFRLPSDLMGVTPAEFDETREDRQAALGPACSLILQKIAQLGIRPDRLTQPIIDRVPDIEGEYHTEKRQDRINIIHLSDNYYRIENPEWEGIGLFDGEFYYGVYKVSDDVLHEELRGNWGAHRARFDAGQQRFELFGTELKVKRHFTDFEGAWIKRTKKR